MSVFWSSWCSNNWLFWFEDPSDHPTNPQCFTVQSVNQFIIFSIIKSMWANHLHNVIDVSFTYTSIFCCLVLQQLSLLVGCGWCPFQCTNLSTVQSTTESIISSQCKLNISVLLCMLLLLTCLFVHFWCFNNWLFGWMWMEFTNHARNISYPSFYGREPDLEDSGRLVKVDPHLCLTRIWMNG